MIDFYKKKIYLETMWKKKHFPLWGFLDGNLILGNFSNRFHFIHTDKSESIFICILGVGWFVKFKISTLISFTV